jgi:hypothetical protein
MNSSCSLTVFAARSDIPFLRQTVSHLAKACGGVFRERILFVDVAPPSAGFRDRPGLGSLETLQNICAELRADGFVDRIMPIDYSPSVRSRIYKKYFNRSFGYTHDLRGAPFYAFLFSFEAAQTDYVVHFDSDMLLYQKPDFDWVSAGIRLLQECEDLMFISPLSGPPSPDGSLKQRGVSYQRDNRGFYRIDVVTGRKFLFNKRRMAKLLPFKKYWLSPRRRIRGWFTGESPLLQLEVILTESFRDHGVFRGDLASPHAWTLHTPDHGPAFVAGLPEVIRRVEAGDYPAEQAGDYDLQLKHWL